MNELTRSIGDVSFRIAREEFCGEGEGIPYGIEKTVLTLETDTILCRSCSRSCGYLERSIDDSGH